MLGRAGWCGVGIRGDGEGVQAAELGRQQQIVVNEHRLGELSHVCDAKEVELATVTFEGNDELATKLIFGCGRRG